MTYFVTFAIEVDARLVERASSDLTLRDKILARMRQAALCVPGVLEVPSSTAGVLTPDNGRTLTCARCGETAVGVCTHLANALGDELGELRELRARIVAELHLEEADASPGRILAALRASIVDDEQAR